MARTQFKLADYLMRSHGISTDIALRKLQCEHVSDQCNKGMAMVYDRLSEEKKAKIKEIYGPKS